MNDTPLSALISLLDNSAVISQPDDECFVTLQCLREDYEKAYDVIKALAPPDDDED